MKNVLTKVPAALGLLCQVLIVVDLGLEIYKHIKKPRNKNSHGNNNESN